MGIRLVEPLASMFGLSSSFVGIAVVIGFAMAVSLLVFTKTGSTVVAPISSMMALMVGVFVGLIPIWIVLMSVLFAGGYIIARGSFGFGGGTTDSADAYAEEAKKELRTKLEVASQKYSQYINNLDKLLGIKTVNGGLSWERPDDYRLVLYYNVLHIDKCYDWFIVDKAEDKNVFKVVGLHKNDDTKKADFMISK